MEKKQRSRGTKRCTGDGSCRKRAGGRYAPGFTASDVKMVSRYGKSLKGVKCTQWSALHELDQGRDFSAGRPMLGDYLEAWLEKAIKPNREPKSLEVYRNLCKLYILPDLARIRLDELNPSQ